MTRFARWGFALLLVGVTAWIFPWLTALMALTALLVYVVDRIEWHQKNRKAFDEDAIQKNRRRFYEKERSTPRTYGGPLDGPDWRRDEHSDRTKRQTREER